MNKKTLTVAGIVIVAILAIFGFTRFNTQGKSAEGETVTVTHISGETEITKNPKKVVVFDYGILDALDALEVEVTGVVKSSLPDYLKKYDADNYEAIGGLKEPDMEKIYEIQPDLIIISGRQASYYEELSKIAPTINLGVVSEDYMGSFTENMNVLGQIFDKEKEVKNKLAEVEKSIKNLNEKATEMNVNGLITLANDGEFSVYGEGSRFGILHQEFGIKPVDTTIEDSTHGVKSTFEYVVEKNPDYLFVVDRSAVTGGSVSAKELFENELVKKTDAYKNGNIVYLDSEVWYTAIGGFTSTEKMVDEVSKAVLK